MDIEAMITGHGIDIVKILHVKRQLKVAGAEFLSTTFTAEEQKACDVGVEQPSKLSGRIAVKEAAMKALGVGFGDGIGFLDIETKNLPSGQPTLVLHRKAKLIAEQQGIRRWLIATSHEAGIAVASVIALNDG